MLTYSKKTIALMLSILLAVSLSGISPVQAAQGTQAPAKIVDIAAGQGYSMALLSDGTVWAWGNNESGIAGTEPWVRDTEIQLTIFGQDQYLSWVM